MAETRLSVRVTPSASHNGLIRYAEGVLYLRLTAPPVEGAANAACCAYVADLLGLRSSQVTVCRGQKSRDKVLLITGSSHEWVVTRLQEASAKS